MLQPAPILAQAWGALITQGGSQPPPSLFWSSSQSHHLCVNSIVFLGESGPKMFFLGHNGIFKFFWLFLEVFFLTFVLFRPPNLPHVNWGPNEISPLVAYLSKFPAQQPPTLQDVHMAFQSVFFCKKQLCLQASTPNLVFFWTFFYGIFLSRKRCRLLYRSPIKDPRGGLI